MGRSDDGARDPVIDAYKVHVDRSLLRQNLARSVEERLLNLMALQRAHEELRLAGRRARRAGGAPRSEDRKARRA